MMVKVLVLYLGLKNILIKINEENPKIDWGFNNE